MTTSPRDTLDRFVAALEAHYESVTRRTGEADPAVIAAYQTLADAFETYDNALYDTYDEVTPFELVDEPDEDEFDESDDEDNLDDEDEFDDEEEEFDDEDDFSDDLDGEDDGTDGEGESGGAEASSSDSQKRSG